MEIKDLHPDQHPAVIGLDVFVKDNKGFEFEKNGQKRRVLKYVFSDSTGEISYVDWNKTP